MGFPTTPNDGDEYTNALGTKYKYLDADHKWYIITGFGAGDLLHNDLDGLNAGDVYEHISAAQFAALHTRLHTITNVLDHSANNHKIFYSDGSGHIIELALGADGEVLTSTGAATAPAFEAAGGGLSEAKVHALLGIGIGNKRWIECNTWGGEYPLHSREALANQFNAGAADMRLSWFIPLPKVITDGVTTYNLVITDIRVGLDRCDDSDYLTRMTLNGWDSSLDNTVLADDATDYTTAQLITYGIADQTIGGVYIGLYIHIYYICATRNQVNTNQVEVEYYYVST